MYVYKNCCKINTSINGRKVYFEIESRAQQLNHVSLFLCMRIITYYYYKILPSYKVLPLTCKMTNRITPELEQFIVATVELTGRVIGAGAYGSVEEVEQR